MIKFKCSKCAQEYRVADDYAGKKVRCKTCNTTNAVPSPDPEHGCGDSLARYNNLLQELLECEKTAPTIEIETK